MKRFGHLFIATLLALSTLTITTLSDPDPIQAATKVENLRRWDVSTEYFNSTKRTSGKTPEFKPPKGTNQISVKTQNIKIGLFKKGVAPPVNAHLYVKEKGKYKHIATINGMTDEKTRTFNPKKRIDDKKTYKVTFSLKKKNKHDVKIDPVYIYNQRKTTDLKPAKPKPRNTTTTTSDGIKKKGKHYVGKKNGKTYTFKSDGTPIKLKVVDMFKQSLGFDPAVNVHLEKKDSNGKFSTVQSHKNVKKGRTVAFTKGVKKGATYRFTFSSDKDIKSGVLQVQFRHYNLEAVDMSTKYYVEPFYSFKNKKVGVRFTEHKKDNHPKVTGNYTYNVGKKSKTAHKEKTNTLALSTDIMTLPKDNKTRSATVKFVGLLGNDPILVKNNISVKMNKGKIKIKKDKPKDGKVKVTATLPKDFDKNGKWTLKLTTGGKNVVDPVKKDGKKRSITKSFDADIFEDKKITIKAFYQDSKRITPKALEVYKGSGEKKVDNASNDGNSNNNVAVVDTSGNDDSSNNDNNNDSSSDNNSSNNDDKDDKKDDKKEDSDKEDDKSDEIKGSIILAANILEDDQVEIQADLKDVTDPKGKWNITLDEDVDEGISQSLEDKGDTVKATFSTKDLTETEVPVTAAFDGKDKDGKKVEVEVTETLTVKEETEEEEVVQEEAAESEEEVDEEETIVVESNGDQNSNGDQVIVQAPETDPVVEESPNQTSSNQEIGGELPKTATKYSFWLIAGVVIFVGGALTLFLRRRTS